MQVAEKWLKFYNTAVIPFSAGLGGVIKLGQVKTKLTHVDPTF